MNTKKIIIIVVVCLLAYVCIASSIYGGLTGRVRLANTAERLFKGGKLQKKKAANKKRRH